MKREIKFRGKRVDNGEWTYGNLFVGENKKTYILSGENLSRFNGIWSLGCGVCEEVNPETIGQYIQLKDKNDTEIYEGDLLQVDNKEPVEVRYEEIYASFGLWRKGFSFLHYFHEYVEPGDCEVIGNIHDRTQITKKEAEEYINRLYESRRFIQNGINLINKSINKACGEIEIGRLKGQLDILELMLASIDKIIDKYKTE
jgi:hypothetical protein